jgi:hypothetical protein
MDSAFICNLISQSQPKQIIQVGTDELTLVLCQSNRKLKDSELTLVDYKRSLSENPCLPDLSDFENDSVERLEAPVDEALPDLCFQDRKIDFAIINQSVRFDEVMVAFYYLNKMLNDGATVIITHADNPVMRRLSRHIVRESGYVIQDSIGGEIAKASLSRLFRQRFQQVPALIRNQIEKVINPALLNEEDTGIQGTTLALTKPIISKVPKPDNEAQLNMDFDTLLQSIMED